MAITEGKERCGICMIVNEEMSWCADADADAELYVNIECEMGKRRIETRGRTFTVHMRERRNRQETIRQPERRNCCGRTRLLQRPVSTYLRNSLIAFARSGASDSSGRVPVFTRARSTLTTGGLPRARRASAHAREYE